MEKPEFALVEIKPSRRGLMAWCGGKILGEVTNYTSDDDYTASIRIKISKARNLVDRTIPAGHSRLAGIYSCAAAMGISPREVDARVAAMLAALANARTPPPSKDD